MKDYSELFSKEARRDPEPTAQDRENFAAARKQAMDAPYESRNRLHFKFDRTLTGKELAEALKASLQEHGIDPANVMVRFFAKDRFAHALRNATDRDESAHVDYHGGTDGERKWMRALGIFSNAQVTYASPLSSYISGGADAPMAQDNAYVIYDKSQLYKVGYASNGFHAFLSVPYRALIGFMSDNGEMGLSKVATPAPVKTDTLKP